MDPEYEKAIRREAEEAMLSAGGAALQSAFPRAEAFLSKPGVRKALRLFIFSEAPSDARSTLDVLFLGLFPEYREAFDRFMADQGPRLNELIDSAQHAEIERTLLYALAQARELFQDRSPVEAPEFRWNIFAEVIRDKLAKPQ